MKSFIFCFFILVSGCSELPYALPNMASTSCSMSDSDLGYSLTIQSFYDFSGVSDSRIRVNCPRALSFLDFTFKGSQPETVKEEPVIDSNVCCLPF